MSRSDCDVETDEVEVLNRRRQTFPLVGHPFDQLAVSALVGIGATRRKSSETTQVLIMIMIMIMIMTHVPF
jgi:hypothetical protein